MIVTVGIITTTAMTVTDYDYDHVQNYNNQRKRECERTLAALPTNMGVMINKHATEHPECKPTLTCVGVYTNLGSANLGWCPFEIERPSVFVLVLRYT